MPPAPPARRLPRRRLLAGALAGAGALGIGLAAPRLPEQVTRLRGEEPVRSATVAFTSATEREALSPAQAADLPPHTRVVPGTATAAAADRQSAFLAETSPWLDAVDARHRDLARSALLDLWVLSDGLPAPVASWAGAWRFIWPRDAAFVAVALARVGLPDLAWAQLRHLQDLQFDDGWFAARYEITGTGVPDDRSAQLDSVGLMLWAVAEVVESLRQATGPAASSPRRGAVGDLTALNPLLDRSTGLLLDLTDHGRALPPTSPDYWEVTEATVNLGIAAPTLIGLDALTRLARIDATPWARRGGTAALTEAAAAFSRTFARTFVAGGLQRYPSSGGLDSALAYLPAAGGTSVVAEAVTLDRMRATLTQPAGGIKPGHGWIFDHASWTPSTSLLGLGYARSGARDRAEEILDWLAAHRTVAGALPEKVDGEGRAESVAPLAWTAANVVLTLDALRAHPAPG